jgi:uncharacterized protein
MAVPVVNKKGPSWPFMAGLVVLTLLCIQGYFFFSQRPAPGKPQKPSVVKPSVKPAKATAGRITIVLDDWGFNRTHCKYLEDFKAPVAPAVLPGLPYSKDVIACAIAAGQDPMLHLPLEPKTNKDPYPQDYILTTAMPQSQVARLLKKYLDEYPGIAGVNNHMGSKATEDREMMTTILKELKRRRLFFVDSATTASSVCPKVAGEVGIPFARRVVFLDNRNERKAIEKEFAKGARIARTDGFALIIGHDRALTLQIVGEQVRKLKQQGFEFLSVRDFIKAQSGK